MSNDKNPDTNVPSEPTEEEKQAEEKVLEDANEDEIRVKIIEKYGFDAEADSEHIDKLVQGELQHKKELSTAIRQKRDWRKKAMEKPAPTEDPASNKDEKFGKEELNSILDERDTKRDISVLEVSDDLKKEVESYAKLNGVSVKEAFASDYIQYRKKGEDDKQREEEASAGGKPGTGTISNLGVMDEAVLNKELKSLDLSTEDGRKRLEEIKKELKKH